MTVISGRALVGQQHACRWSRKMLPCARDRVGRAVALGGVVGVVEEAVDGLVAVQVDDGQVPPARTTADQAARAAIDGLWTVAWSCGPPRGKEFGGVQEGAAASRAWRPTADRRGRSASARQASTSSGVLTYSSRGSSGCGTFGDQHGDVLLGAQRRRAPPGAGRAGEVAGRRRLVDPHALEEGDATAAVARLPRPCLAAASMNSSRPAGEADCGRAVAVALRRCARRCRGAARARRGGRRCRSTSEASTRPWSERSSWPAPEVGVPLDLDGVRDVQPLPRARPRTKSSRWAQASPRRSVSRSSVPRASTRCV